MLSSARLRLFAGTLIIFSMCAMTRGQGLSDLLDKEDTGPDARPRAAAVPTQSGAARITGNDERRLPAMNEDQRRAAAAKVREVFAADLAKAKSPKQMAAIAEAMYSVAGESSDPAEIYVLLEMSAALAVDGHQATTLTQALASLEKRFGVDVAEKRREALSAMSKKAATEKLGDVIDALVVESSRCAKAGAFGDAKDAAKAAATGARRLRDPVRQKKAAELLQEIAEEEKAQAVIQPLLDRLRSNPGDRHAMLDLGKYRCFEEGNWDLGLKLLAQCSDPALAEIARKDLSVDGSAAAHEKVGDLWFALRGNDPGKGPSGPSERAKYHYERAIGSATGLERAKILKRLDELVTLDGGSAAWTVIFRSNDPSIWNTKTEEGSLRFSLPIDAVPPTVRYVRVKRPNGDAVVLPLTKQQLGQDITGERYGWRGAGTKMSKDTFLGVCDVSQKLADNDVGKVFVGHKDGVLFSGWGFGHKYKSGNQTSMAWDGQTVPREPLEISVLTRELTAKERRQSKLLE